MAIAGRVAIVPNGDWSADATYKRLDAVTYNNTLYFAKKDVPAGTVTSNTEYWSKSIVGGAGAIATTKEAGIVKPDGTTITVDADGTIHGKSEIKVDGTTITLDEAKGIISLAKTLQEKIGTIDDKLPAANVANNQITTEEGFALDARQANPNLDGTLAKQLSDLNGSLKNENLIPINIDGMPYNNLNFYVIRGGYCYLSLYIPDINNTDPIFIYGVPNPILSLNFPVIHYHYNSGDNKIALGSVFKPGEDGTDKPHVRINPKEVNGLAASLVYPIAFN